MTPPCHAVSAADLAPQTIDGTGDILLFLAHRFRAAQLTSSWRHQDVRELMRRAEGLSTAFFVPLEEVCRCVAQRGTRVCGRRVCA
jgi:hypothetical protein